ncbi:hypothetical protein [Sporolactobacillus vineae]|uniref:hypothetical protein n=1 Tax=Sporolactobacillus vineae TaxID=444463 RepID=UPI000288507F|nr:hypothetical protein [Sporolactobacillus vineae]
MKLKRFMVGLCSFALTSGFLYFVGYLFAIPFLTLHYEYVNDAHGFFFSINSILPLIVGLIVSYFAEKIFMKKHQKKPNNFS